MEHLDEKIINMINEAKNQNSVSLKAEKFEQDLKLLIGQIKSGHAKIDDLDIEMERKEFFDKCFSIYLPKDLKQMQESIAKIKYPSEARPKIIYTNNMDTLNIGINYSDQELLNEDVYAFRDVMKDAFIALNPSLEILDFGELIIDESNVGYYAFPNFAIGGQLYNLIFVLSFKGKALVCNFNCLKKDLERRKLLFYGIMNTISISKEV